jgi:hypothetical protein
MAARRRASASDARHALHLSGGPKRRADGFLPVLRPVGAGAQHGLWMGVRPLSPLELRQRARLDPARRHPHGVFFHHGLHHHHHAGSPTAPAAGGARPTIFADGAETGDCC